MLREIIVTLLYKDKKILSVSRRNNIWYPAGYHVTCILFEIC